MTFTPRPAVLVTGGAGYIGTHACKALHRAGFRPVTFDNLSLGNEKFVKWGPLVVGDTRDADLIARTIAEHDIQGVIHFAALSSVGESIATPADYYDNNINGLLGALGGMRMAGCSAMVFSSTAAVYGNAGSEPIPETAPRGPVNPYGWTKAMCEQILADFQTAYGLRWTALRYFNASGADPDGEIGEFRASETHLIPRAMMALQGHIKDFRVFGSDFPTPDGTAIRDYIHVSDLAEAHVIALKAMLDGSSGGVFNLGVGQGYSVGQVLETIGRVSGRDMAAPTGGRRAGDPAILIADSRRAREILGFNPSHSALQTIVETAWAWHCSAHPLRNSPSDTDID